MSLLMKALEKAAKDRVDSDAERAPETAAATPGAAAKGEMSLEPLAQKAAAAATPSASRDPTMTARRPAASAGGAAASREAAATVIRASSRGAGGGVGALMRERPILVVSGLAIVFALGYGGYLYLQLANPAAFVRQPPPRPVQAPPTTPVAQAPAGSAATASGGTVAPAPTAVPTAPLLQPLAQAAEKEKSEARPAASPAPAGSAAQPAQPAVPVAPPPAAAAAVRDTIKVVSGGSAPPSVNPLVAEGYAELTAGNLDSSQKLYSQMLRSEPGNIDAQLGLAAIAMQQGNSDQATKHYLAVLQRDPRNAYAQAGLIAIVGAADPLSAETRVKQLIAREPSAYLYYTLGNIYVDQNRWPDAQQAYFQAHHLQPDNPDYAYNLAVALEHIGQPKAALEFYRRAVQAAAAKGRASFSPAAAQDRVSKLESVLR